MTDVEAFLHEHGITFTRHDHPAVFTCEDSERLGIHLPGIHSKNLFLKNRKKTRFFLVTIPAEKRADLKKLGILFGEKDLSFGSPEQLKEKLGLTPGSVSPFGLINDKLKEIEIYLDSDVANAGIVNFHPNINTASLELTKEMFQKFFTSLDRKYEIIEI